MEGSDLGQTRLLVVMVYFTQMLVSIIFNAAAVSHSVGIEVNRESEDLRH